MKPSMGVHKSDNRERDELARALANEFRGRGRELFLVGGSVRDQLLGRLSPDLDFATSALPDETASVLAAFAGKEPYRVGEKYGTIGLRIDGRLIEITTYRTGE